MQDDIPAIVKAIINVLLTSVPSEIYNNETHSTQSTSTDGDKTQICQSATGEATGCRCSTCSSIRGGGTTQTCTANANANNNCRGGFQLSTEPGIEPSADNERRSTGTTAGDAAASSINNDDMNRTLNSYTGFISEPYLTPAWDYSSQLYSSWLIAWTSHLSNVRINIYPCSPRSHLCYHTTPSYQMAILLVKTFRYSPCQVFH